MSRNGTFWAHVDEEGRLVLPPEMIASYGLQPGAPVCIDPIENGLSLRRPVTHLARIYVEPTNQCNLACRTCIRNTWDEPMGRMTDATFGPIIEGLARLFAAADCLFRRFRRTAVPSTHRRNGRQGQEHGGMGGVNHQWHTTERRPLFDFSPCTFCGGCEMAESNEEDCFGNPFPTCGGCLWAQGVIRCP